MDFLSDWADEIPSGDRLYALLAVGIIFVAVVGNILFIGFFIVPKWRVRNQRVSQLAEAEQQLVKTRRGGKKNPEQLEEQLATAQARLDEAAGVFFSESEAAEVLDRLYRYADDSDVKIISLQSQPGPEQEKKSVYDARTFQLQAVGTVLNLIDFASRIKEAASRSFIVDDANIEESDVGHTLTLGFTLYTSPYSSGAAIGSAVEATPSATPENLAELVKALDSAWASGDWIRVIDLLRQIGAVDPGYRDLEEKLYAAYVSYGYQLLERGETAKAKTEFDLALGIKPNGQEALTGLQRTAVTPTPTLTMVEQLAGRLDKAWAERNWEEVINLLEQIRTIDPDYDDVTQKLYAAHVNHGYALADLGRLTEAKEAFGRALDIKPNGGEAAAGLEKLAAGAIPQPTSEPGHAVYVVQPGDNLFRIALRFDTSVEAIMAANGLTTHTIHVGQRLKIPTH